MSCLYMHTYDTKIGGLNTISYPIISSNENNKGEVAYTVRKTPFQTETINKSDLEKITIFKIEPETNSVKICEYSMDPNRTDFKNKLITTLENFYKETMAQNYATISKSKPFDIDRNKENDIVTNLLKTFGVTPDEIDTSPVEINTASKQNPKYYYEHIYFMNSNEFATNTYKVKFSDATHIILQSIENEQQRKVNNDMIDVVAKITSNQQYVMFSKNADISDFQNEIINELSNDTAIMEYQNEILKKAIDFNKSVIKNLTKNVKVRTKITELYEFMFKDGKYSIKTHKITNADAVAYTTETGISIPRRNMNELEAVPTEWTKEYHVGGIYHMYSCSNDASTFKQKIREKLESTKYKINNLEMPSAKKAKDNTDFAPDKYSPDIQNYIKASNTNSKNSLILYRFIRDGLFGDNRGTKFTATTIPFVKSSEKMYTIYEETDDSICKIPRNYLQNLKKDSNGNMSMWLEKPDFQFFIDRVIIELTTEANAIAKYK